MMLWRIQEWLEKQRVVLDAQDYEECTFVDCTLIYRGGEPPTLSNNSFVRCAWDLDDAALRTLGFFAVLNMSGLRDIVEVDDRYPPVALD